VKLTTHHT